MSQATQFLTTSGVARRTEKSEGTVRHWRRTGRLKPVSITESGVALYDSAQIEQFAEQVDKRRHPR
jgi:DNA-binding transcriptional MerR regulator